MVEEKVFYESTDGVKLCGLLSKVNDSGKLVILCHGLKGDKTERNSFIRLVESLQEENINSFRFDFRGHGESSGNDYEMTVTKEVCDLEKTIEMLNAKGFDKFVVLGASFGASITSLIDFHKYNSVEGVVCWYGALDFKATIEEDGFFSSEHRKIAEKDGYYPIVSKRTGNVFKLGLDLFKEIDEIIPYESLVKVELPILFVHGMKDDMVPYQLSEKIALMCKNSKVELINEGNHTFNNDPKVLEEAVDVTVKFVKDILI